MPFSRLVARLSLFSALVVGGCYVETGPPPASDPSYVAVPPPAPPPPAPEAAPPPPSGDSAWIPAAHRWNGHAYEVQHGHYEKKPRPEAQYVAGHWEKRGGGHNWIEGHWQ